MKKKTRVKQWLLRLMVISAILTAAVLTVVSARAYALEDYYVTEDNSFSFTIEQNVASSTASYRYETVAWYLFPAVIEAKDNDTAPFDEYYNGESINKSFYDKKGINASANRSNRDDSDPTIYVDTFTISGEKMMTALKKWWNAGAIERSDLEAGITLYASRPLNILKNGKKIGTVYSLPEMHAFCEKNGFDWSSKSWKTFKSFNYDQKIYVSFSKTGFSVEAVDETGTPVAAELSGCYAYSDIYYGETTDTIQYPGAVSGYEYIGYEITAGGKQIQKGNQTTVSFTAKYNEIKENDVVLTFYYKTVQEGAGFVPTATPTPTATPAPTPTSAPGATATATPAPTATPRPTATPAPDAISEANYVYYFTTDMGHSMEQVVGNSKHTVASCSGSTISGTLSSAASTKLSSRYKEGTDKNGNTWYFISDGNNATYVHPAVYNGYDANSTEVKYITELIFPSTITYSGSEYTVVSIGGGTSKYHSSSDKFTDTTSYDYGTEHGYYCYYKEQGNENGTVGYYRISEEDHEYAYGILGNGYIETYASTERTKLSNGEYQKTKVWRNYYVYNTTLVSITIPDTVTCIAPYAFLYCQNLSEIKGGSGIQTIGKSAFEAADVLKLFLTSVDISKEYTDGKVSTIYTWIDYYFYNNDSKWAGWVSENGVRHDDCSHEDEHLDCIWIAETDTELMLHTKKVSELTEVRMKSPNFPALLTIRERAFALRKNLWDVELSSIVKNIYAGAFYRCELDSIRIPGSGTQVFGNSYLIPEYETLGTNKAEKNRTIIYTTPSASNVVTYGRTWSNYYRLKAGYTITYHSNDDTGREVEQMTDIGFYTTDWVWCAETVAISGDGTIYGLEITNGKLKKYSVLGTLSGGFAGVEYIGQYQYIYEFSFGDSVGTTQTSMTTYYIRDGEGNLWACDKGYYYDSQPRATKINIPAGTEVMYNSFCCWLDETGQVSYFEPTTCSIFQIYIKEPIEKLICMSGNGMVLACGKNWFKLYNSVGSITYKTITAPSGITPLVCNGNLDWIVDTEGNIYDKNFEKMTYTGGVNLATLQCIKGKLYGIYEEAMHPVTIYVEKDGIQYSPNVLVKPEITGVIRETFDLTDSLYYWMEDGSVIYYGSIYGKGIVYEPILSGKIIKKLTYYEDYYYDEYDDKVMVPYVFALTEDGAIYDISDPARVKLMSLDRRYTDIFYTSKTDCLFAVAEDGTVWRTSEYARTPLKQVSNIKDAIFVTCGSIDNPIVYSKNGIYLYYLNDWTPYIINCGTYFDAEIWGYMFENPGLTCTEWNTKADGTGTGYHPEDKISLTADLELYAIWGTAKAKTVIQYDRNGGAGTMSATTLDEEETTAMVKFNQFVRKGYHFTTWNTKADGSGTTYKEGEIITVESGTITTLYAQWAAEDYLSPDPEVFSYTLVYMRYPYGTAINEVWKSKKMSYLEVETVEGQPYEVALGYKVNYEINTPAGMSTTPTALEKLSDSTGAPVFNKWRLYILKDGSYIYQGKQYEKGSTVSGLTKENGEIVYLYPTWKAGESSVILPYTEAEGYIFRGWNESADGMGLLHPVYSPEDADNIGTFTPVRNTILYGDWEPVTKEICLNGMGADIQEQTEAVIVFDRVMSAVTIPTKKNYVFLGYYTELDENGVPTETSIQVTDKKGQGTIIMNNVNHTFDEITEVYAYWRPKELTSAEISIFSIDPTYIVTANLKNEPELDPYELWEYGDTMLELSMQTIGYFDYAQVKAPWESEARTVYWEDGTYDADTDEWKKEGNVIFWTSDDYTDEENKVRDYPGYYDQTYWIAIEFYTGEELVKEYKIGLKLVSWMTWREFIHPSIESIGWDFNGDGIIDRWPFNNGTK